VLTHDEAIGRAALLDNITCHISLDLTATPPRGHTELRFSCRRPGATTFADLSGGTATLNGVPLGPPDDGRLLLPDLAAENVLVADLEIPDRVLSRSGDYLLIACFPTSAPDVFACFDQPGLEATVTLTAAVEEGWTCLANGAGERDGDGVWRFAPVWPMKAYDFAFCAGPFAGNGENLWYRRELTGSAATLDAFAATAGETMRYYEGKLGIPRPYPKYDIVFHPRLRALAMSVPGLMVVSESLLDRMIDPADDFPTVVARHEVAHQWFGCLVGMRWWDDLWLDEAMANFVSYRAAGDWVEFAYRAEENAYHIDELPGSVPVSSPVETMAQALDTPSTITYVKGAAAIRQLAALIGEDAIYRGLTDYLTRFAGSAALEDLIGCWSLASGRDLAGWADDWLRTSGHSTLWVEDGAVLQDNPRTHHVGVGLYELDGGRLRPRRTIEAEVSGERTEIGDVSADAILPNHGDLTFARVRFDARTLRTLQTVGLNVGDPLTEAVCWTTAWHMMTSAELAARDLVGLVIRRLEADPPLPLPGLEVLADRAVRAANGWAPLPDRAALRELLATRFLDFTERRTAGPSDRRLLAAGFAASAESPDQLATVRSWLTASWADLPLRWKFLGALSANGLDIAAEVGALAGQDPAGEYAEATCLARRPDRSSKQEAWSAALEAATKGEWRMAAAHAEGIWVPGQEELMAPFLDQYFGQALPMLIALGQGDPALGRDTRRLAGLLFPVTLADEITVAAADQVLWDTLPVPMRDLLTERVMTLRNMIAARAAA
jgi:aminopeptidase N